MAIIIRCICSPSLVMVDTLMWKNIVKNHMQQIWRLLRLRASQYRRLGDSALCTYRCTVTKVDDTCFFQGGTRRPTWFKRSKLNAGVRHLNHYDRYDNHGKRDKSIMVKVFCNHALIASESAYQPSISDLIAPKYRRDKLQEPCLGKV